MTAPSNAALGKRPAEEPAAPTMTKQAAAKAVKVMLPAAPKELTLYMRFKAHLAAKTGAKGKDLTEQVKSAWEPIKSYPTSQVGTSFAPQYLEVKKAAEDEEAAHAGRSRQPA